MVRISDSVESFTDALDSKQPVVVNKNGNWSVEGRLMRIVSWIFGLESSRFAAVCRAFSRCLEDLEKVPPKFNAGNGALIDDQQKILDSYLGASRALSVYSFKFRCSKVDKELLSINQKVAAMQYRMAMEQPAEAVDEVLVEEVTGLALNWKNSEKLYEGVPLSDKDHEKIREVCRYADFAVQLKNHDDLRKSFFKWIIRYDNPVRHFVEYPERCQRVAQVYLAQRVGRFAGAHFRIKQSHDTDGIIKKELTLPFEVLGENNELETRDISILNEEALLTMRGGCQTTIKKIFQVIQKKDTAAGDFEFFGDLGIVNWNTHLHAWKTSDGNSNAIDYLKERWWEQLPVFEVISKEQLEARYQLKIQDGNWVGVVKSTSESLELDVDRSHGYLEVAIPTEDDQYQILDFGKFAEKFPEKSFDNISFLAKTLRSHLQYPDSNEFYSQRQHAAAPFELTPEKGGELMVEIQRTMIRSKYGRLIFQFGYENCAWWPQHVFKKILGEECPNFFYEEALEARPSNPLLRRIFSIIRKSPKVLQPSLILALQTVLIPWRGVYVVRKGKLEKMTLAKTPFTKTLKMWHPSALHERIKSRKIRGLIYFGHQMEKIHENR